MKIVILDGYALNPGDLSWDCLRQFGSVTVYDRTPSNLAAERIGDAEIVLTNKTPITEDLLVLCPSVRLICVLATGYNVVDCEAARRRGIPVCNVPAYGTNSVAQFTFALLLEICNRVGCTVTPCIMENGLTVRISATGRLRKWSWLAKRWELSDSGASVGLSERLPKRWAWK